MVPINRGVHMGLSGGVWAWWIDPVKYGAGWGETQLPPPGFSWLLDRPLIDKCSMYLVHGLYAYNTAFGAITGLFGPILPYCYAIYRALKQHVYVYAPF